MSSDSDIKALEGIVDSLLVSPAAEPVRLIPRTSLLLVEAGEVQIKIEFQKSAIKKYQIVYNSVNLWCCNS